MDYISIFSYQYSNIAQTYKERPRSSAQHFLKTMQVSRRQESVNLILLRIFIYNEKYDKINETLLNTDLKKKC